MTSLKRIMFLVLLLTLIGGVLSATKIKSQEKNFKELEKVKIQTNINKEKYNEKLERIKQLLEK